MKLGSNYTINVVDTLGKIAGFATASDDMIQLNGYTEVIRRDPKETVILCGFSEDGGSLKKTNKAYIGGVDKHCVTLLAQDFGKRLYIVINSSV